MLDRNIKEQEVSRLEVMLEIYNEEQEVSRLEVMLVQVHNHIIA